MLLAALGGGCSPSDDGASNSIGSDASSDAGSIECGATLLCHADSACVADNKAPKCTSLLGDAGCPTGQDYTTCPPLNYPCCCGPHPPGEYRCAEVGSCDLKPACMCQCKSDQSCMVFGTETHCFDQP